MKKFLLLSLIMVFSLNGLAIEKPEQIDQKKQDLTNQSFELLIKNIDHIKLDGDIAPGEKLKPILDELGEFLGHAIFSTMGDDEKYDGRIKNFTADCSLVSERKSAAKCELFIEYKPLGETGILFYVGLDKENKPVSILENRVSISRGD